MLCEEGVVCFIGDGVGVLGLVDVVVVLELVDVVADFIAAILAASCFITVMSAWLDDMPLAIRACVLCWIVAMQSPAYMEKNCYSLYHFPRI